MKESRPSLWEDMKYVGKLAAKVGFAVAIVCHFLPPDYRPICDAIASACTGSF